MIGMERLAVPNHNPPVLQEPISCSKCRGVEWLESYRAVHVGMNRLYMKTNQSRRLVGVCQVAVQVGDHNGGGLRGVEPVFLKDDGNP